MDSCTNQESLNDNNNVHKSPNIFSRCHTLSKIQTGLHISNNKLLNDVLHF